MGRTAKNYLEAANIATNYYDIGNILARGIGHEKLISKLEKAGYQSLALRLIEAVAFRYENANQALMKKVLEEYA